MMGRLSSREVKILEELATSEAHAKAYLSGTEESLADMSNTSFTPGSQRFHDILGELGLLHDKKQQDYGTPTDPFANVRGSLDWGIPPWVGALVRASDKFKRLQKYARVGELANEAVEDSFRDLAIYAIIGLVLFEESKQVGTELGANTLLTNPALRGRREEAL